MTAKIARETWVKVGYCAFLLVAAVFSVFQMLTRVQEATRDDAIRNQLRNIYAVAGERFADRQVTSVKLADLDQAELRRRGAWPIISGIAPLVVEKGAKLSVTAVDGRRTVVYEPGK